MIAFVLSANGQTYTLAGIVVDNDNGKAVEYASVLLAESGQWAVTNSNGEFTIKHVPQGKATLSVQCLGYVRRTLPMELRRDVTNLRVKIKADNLKLDEVVVTARRKTDEATTSYTIDRTTLDNQQMLNLGDLQSLLPGGKTVNSTLMDDSRLSLRSGSSEKGNASFGTAVEIDGVRIDNNAMTGETLGASTRNISSSNIESVEIVTGIPSVEYGDLSNGVVKVSTRKGKSPFIIEGKINQHTHQVAVNKGFALGSRGGVLNASFEHAQSFTNISSPHTAYQRNTLSLHYMNMLVGGDRPLTLNLGFSGNVGGYNSEADPDQMLDDYDKVRDNALRGNIDLNWMLNKKWLTNIELKAAVNYSDKRSESYYNTNSASTQPYVHTRSQGYFIARDYDAEPDANIILGPTGYWYVRRYGDQKPLDWSVKLKAQHNSHFTVGTRQVRNRIIAGAQYSGSRNNGRGTYYEDMRYAPSWREYRYDELPTLNNIAFYAEDKLSVATAKLSTLELTAGLRDDITAVSGSSYGTVSSLSPRVNARYIFWQSRRKRIVSDLSIHAGWGKSVKLPSFQVLFPSPSYSDHLVFSSTSDSENRSYYAYHTYPMTAQYNPTLRWQYTNQTDVGIEATIKGTRITLSAFHHRTYRPYMSTAVYMPFSYNYTAPSALNALPIAADDRTFTIDATTGTVTAAPRSGGDSYELVNSERHTYVGNNTYINADPIDRYGLEWIIDFAKIKPLQTSIRLDGNYYYYKGIDETLFADVPLGISTYMKDGRPYQYIGYYRGSDATSTGYSASASVSNGSLSKRLNMNATITTHIPKIRMVVALRIECSLYQYSRRLSELSNGTRGIVVENGSDNFGTAYDGTTENQYIAVYPEYYSTWENPDERIPFADVFTKAYADANNATLPAAEQAAAKTLYDDLSRLVVRSNYPYTMNPDRLSAYYSANISITKEFGDHVSVSFYANNFLNNMGRVRSTQTGLETSLFASSYIPSFYYGLSLRLKL